MLNMAKRKDNRGFQSAAGLIRYFEEEKTGVKIDPKVVIGMAIVTAVVVTALKLIYPM